MLLLDVVSRSEVAEADSDFFTSTWSWKLLEAKFRTGGKIQDSEAVFIIYPSAMLEMIILMSREPNGASPLAYIECFIVDLSFNSSCLISVRICCSLH